ncbi:hypothetical protein HOD38_05115 [archaeon]|nr:hypothetical protein [archaeon]MBT4397620.1 hypothetical protein [archaeon]MBT4441081.1 hypothetical protein [archaeon]
MVLKEKFKISPEAYKRLEYSWDMIHCIEDFINCIALHKKDLKSPRNIGLMNFMRDFSKVKDFNPAVVLRDYIYLEAHSFFKYINKLKSKRILKNIPELPSYFRDLEVFRNSMPAHRDIHENHTFPADWIRLQEKTNKLIPIKMLIKDVDDYFNCLSSSSK